MSNTEGSAPTPSAASCGAASGGPGHAALRRRRPKQMARSAAEQASEAAEALSVWLGQPF